MSRTPALLLPLLALSGLALAASPAPEDLKADSSAYFDQAAPRGGAPTTVEARAAELAGSAQKVAQVPDLGVQPPPIVPPSPDQDANPPPVKRPKTDGFMGGFGRLLNWDSRSLPAFAIGMGIGLGIVFFSGMLLANPLMGIAAGLFAGLIIGFVLNAFKG